MEIKPLPERLQISAVHFAPHVRHSFAFSVAAGAVSLESAACICSACVSANSGSPRCCDPPFVYQGEAGIWVKGDWCRVAAAATASLCWADVVQLGPAWACLKGLNDVSELPTPMRRQQQSRAHRDRSLHCDQRTDSPCQGKDCQHGEKAGQQPALPGQLALAVSILPGMRYLRCACCIDARFWETLPCASNTPCIWQSLSVPPLRCSEIRASVAYVRAKRRQHMCSNEYDVSHKRDVLGCRLMSLRLALQPQRTGVSACPITVL